MGSKGKIRLLFVEDNLTIARSLSLFLQNTFEVMIANDADTARGLVLKKPDIVLLDIHLSRSDFQAREGILLLREFLEIYPRLPVVIISAYGDLSTAMECMRYGAADFIQKPPNPEELVQRLLRAVEYAQTKQKMVNLEERLRQLAPVELVGESVAMRQVKRLIERISSNPYSTVLIEGETGTGKELVARLIHLSGSRSKKPFVAVSIASLNPNLVESELFGHVRGAFAGANETRVGYIEKAGGGVLFLDEIGELSLEMQVKLLRFLEERVFYPVGSSDGTEVDVQIVAATHRNLKELVERKLFREDLYYRLNVLPVYLPPLRERLEDIPLLVEYFLGLFLKQGRTKIGRVSEEAIEAMQSYSWPGNVRQLKNELERALLQADLFSHSCVERFHLSSDVLKGGEAFGGSQGGGRVFLGEGETLDLGLELARYEYRLIELALRAADGKKTEAWKLLRLNDRYSLHRRIRLIYRKYPEILKDFPFIFQLYGKQLLGRGKRGRGEV